MSFDAFQLRIGQYTMAHPTLIAQMPIFLTRFGAPGQGTTAIPKANYIPMLVALDHFVKTGEMPA